MRHCGRTFSFVFLNDKFSGFLAVATAISPWSMTSWTRWLPNPVEVPVMKKTRGMMADVDSSLPVLRAKPVNLNIRYLSEDRRRGADTYTLSAPGVLQRQRLHHGRF
jgi:hypothetical protein